MKLLIFLVLIGQTMSLSMECEVDADCSDGKSCRMICHSTCKTKCIDLTTFRDELTEEPFIANFDAFKVQRDDSATPLTISEVELEKELKHGFATTIPPNSEIKIEPIPPEIQATTAEIEINPTVEPPSQSPEPPGITRQDYESGYLNGTDWTIFTPKFTEVGLSMETKSSGYDSPNLGVSTEQFNETNLPTITPEIEDTTFSMENSEFIESTTVIVGNSIKEKTVPAEPLQLNGCPPPEICDKNCGVFLDENGCQTCQCLWLGIPCEADSDCVEIGQFCDLGRCECKIGYIQDMKQSGICKRDETISDDEFQKVEAEVKENKAEKRNYSIRKKRSQTMEKPRRMERLQWPGPCDRDSQCPRPLHCIQGDCWHLPDKPFRFNLNDEPKSFKIERRDEEIKASTITPLPDSKIQELEFPDEIFPHPPSSQTFEFVTTEEPKPPSLRPFDDDETSFLGDFRALIGTDAPILLTEIEKKSFHNVPKRKFRNETSSKSKIKHFGTVAEKKNLIELIAGHHFDEEQPESLTTKQSSLFVPKNRHPKVASEGWKPMTQLKRQQPIHSKLPKRDMTAKVILDYSRENRMRRPVRVEMSGARNVIRDECSSNKQCGERYMCCEKQWLDLSRESGIARFCLPDCETTKMTYLSSTGIEQVPLIDLVYD